MKKIREEDKVINGYWNGEPIWRAKTPEEKLQEAGIKPEVANLFIAGNEAHTSPVVSGRE